MSNYTVSTESVVLLIDILHDFTVGDGVVPIFHMTAVTFVEAVSQQGNHRASDCLLIIGTPTQSLQLSVILTGDDAQREYAGLLYPVLLNNFPHGTPVHKHSSHLYEQPGTAAVIVRQYWLPGAVVAIVHHALFPCSIIVVPDCSIGVRQQQIRTLGSVVRTRVVAAEIRIGRTASRTIAPQTHCTVAPILNISLNDIC